jgi:hypothetical protein
MIWLILPENATVDSTIDPQLGFIVILKETEFLYLYGTISFLFQVFFLSKVDGFAKKFPIFPTLGWDQMVFRIKGDMLPLIQKSSHSPMPNGTW